MTVNRNRRVDALRGSHDEDLSRNRSRPRPRLEIGNEP